MDKFLNDEIEDALSKLRIAADEVYFNGGDSLIPDDVYDVLPVNTIAGFKVGSTPTGEKTPLPIWMGSLNKIYFEKELQNWIKKNHPPSSYIVQHKLDGVSCLIFKDVKKNCVNAYTRGDGTNGTDITHLIPSFLSQKQRNDKILDTFMIRGELIISKENFKMYPEFSNARNLVSGIVNRKNVKMDKVQGLSFVSYELIKLTDGPEEEPLSQMKLIKSSTFDCVPFTTWRTSGPRRLAEPAFGLAFSGLSLTLAERESQALETLSEPTLKSFLQKEKEQSIFEMDGLVIYANKKYKREDLVNPKYATAFKIKGEHVKEAKVISLEWRVEKTGAYKPKVHISPVQLLGTTIKCLSGFNAKFIERYGIGPDAIIFVTRAGDVIPYIIGVKEKSKPTFPEHYTWQGSDIIQTLNPNENRTEGSLSEEHDIKRILHFINSVGIPFMKEATVTKIYKNGFHTIDSFLKLTQNDLLIFGPNLSKTIFESLQLVYKTSPEKLLTGYNVFGNYIGEKKNKLLLESHPNLFSYDTLDTVDLMKIKGFSSKTSDQIKKFYPSAKKTWESLISQIPSLLTIPDVYEHQNTSTTEAKEKSVCLSGTRNKDFVSKLKSIHMSVSETLTRNTSFLIVKDNAWKAEKETSKIKKAKQFNIPILSIEEFEKLYGIE
ncbi:NAD-dependent DNA ligase [Armadillidium vulgare iridescent virus]|uniref:DNA ligase (NAD(+)) n=1 Tax=Armadillidium vulgare iridescent virus TaxID=72201 RepID=A0A068QKD0_9VIRU|nr:NAD-dependent DNA ligase [Armadillidium vulgare iridescent virus]CCV02482.1 NAD-dependent DNA ligase [Armadillidium vulgare iridescent virus]